MSGSSARRASVFGASGSYSTSTSSAASRASSRVSATSLLEQNAAPSEDEIRKALQGNICRCTGYWNIIKAVKAASGQEVGDE